jgi:hypothetical protein
MRITKTALVSTLFLGTAISAAQAERCFRPSPFVDVIRVAPVIVQDEALGGTHTLLVGNWTTSLYSLTVVGSQDVSINPSGIRIGLHGTNHTGFFGNHTDCTLDAIPGGGPGLGSCDGKVTGIFNISPSPSLTPVSCDSVGPSAPAVVGKAAGE